MIFQHLRFGELSCNQPLSTAFTACKVARPFRVYDRFRHGVAALVSEGTQREEVTTGLAGKVLVLTRGGVTGRFSQTYRWCR